MAGSETVRETRARALAVRRDDRERAKATRERRAPGVSRRAVNLYLSTETYEALRVAAFERRTSMAEVVERALGAWFAEAKAVE